MPGRGRPFQKGQSGNPGGRPKVAAEVKELARVHTAEAKKQNTNDLWRYKKPDRGTTGLLDQQVSADTGDEIPPKSPAQNQPAIGSRVPPPLPVGVVPKLTSRQTADWYQQPKASQHGRHISE